MIIAFPRCYRRTRKTNSTSEFAWALLAHAFGLNGRYRLPIIALVAAIKAANAVTGTTAGIDPLMKRT